MGQNKGNILDELAPISALDALAPVKAKPKGVATRAIEAIMSPVPPISRGMQRLANKVDIADRGIKEQPFSMSDVLGDEKSPTRDLDIVENLGWLGAGITGIPSIIEAGKALPYALKNLYSGDPEVALASGRGMAAGTLEALGNTSAGDILGLLLGLKAARKLRGVPESSPGSPAAAAPGLPAPGVARVTRNGAVIAERPMNPVATGRKVGEPTTEQDLRQAIEELKSGTRRVDTTYQPELAKSVSALERGDYPSEWDTELPVTVTEVKKGTGTAPDDPALPKIKSIQLDPIEGPRLPGVPLTSGRPRRIPDPGGQILGRTEAMVESANEALRDATRRVRQAMAAENGGGTSAGGKLPRMSKLTPKNRPPRPEAKASPLVAALDDLDAAAAEFEAAQALAKAEPETLAPRNPKLEELANEMEATAEAPNQAVNQALLAESVAGPSGRVQKPGQPKPAPPQTSSDVQVGNQPLVTTNAPKVGQPINYMGNTYTVIAAGDGAVTLSGTKGKGAKGNPAPRITMKVPWQQEGPVMTVAPDAAELNARAAAAAPARIREAGEVIPTTEFRAPNEFDATPTRMSVDDALKVTNSEHLKLAASDPSIIDALAEDMRVNGFRYDPDKPIITRSSGNGQVEIADGHHRLLAAKKAGIDEVYVVAEEEFGLPPKTTKPAELQGGQAAVDRLPPGPTRDALQKALDDFDSAPAAAAPDVPAAGSALLDDAGKAAATTQLVSLMNMAERVAERAALKGYIDDNHFARVEAAVEGVDNVAAGFTSQAEFDAAASRLRDEMDGVRQARSEAKRPAPDAAVPKASKFGDLRDAANADLLDGYNDIVQALKDSGLASGPNVFDPRITTGVGKIAKGILKRGVVEAQAAWDEFERIVGASAGKLRGVFDEVWAAELAEAKKGTGAAAVVAAIPAAAPKATAQPAMPPLSRAKPASALPPTTRVAGQVVVKGAAGDAPKASTQPPARTPAETVPAYDESQVTKVESAVVKAVPASKIDLSALTPSEKLRFMSLEKSIPSKSRLEVQNGSAISKVSTDMLDKVWAYRDLYDKAAGRTRPVAAAEPVRLEAGDGSPRKLDPQDAGRPVLTRAETKAADVAPRRQPVEQPRVEAQPRGESPADVAVRRAKLDESDAAVDAVNNDLVDQFKDKGIVSAEDARAFAEGYVNKPFIARPIRGADGKLDYTRPDQEAVLYNAALRRAKGIEGGQFTERFLKSFPHLKGQLARIVSWSDDNLNVEMKDGSGAVVGREDVTGVAVPAGRKTSPVYKTVMNPERFDPETGALLQGRKELPAAADSTPVPIKVPASVVEAVKATANATDDSKYKIRLRMRVEDPSTSPVARAAIKEALDEAGDGPIDANKLTVKILNKEHELRVTADKARAKVTDDLAASNLKAAAAAQGVEAPKVESTSARSEAVARQVAMPEAPRVGPTPKMFDAAVEDALKPQSLKEQMEAFKAERMARIDKWREGRAAKGKPSNVTSLDEFKRETFHRNTVETLGAARTILNKIIAKEQADKAISDSVLADVRKRRMAEDAADQAAIDAVAESKYQTDLKAEIAAARAKVAGRPKPEVRPITNMDEVGPPPKGIEPRLWKAVHAIEAEFARVKSKHGITDARLVNEMRRFWGADEAARRLGITKAEVETLSGEPHKRRPLTAIFEDMDRRMQFLIDDPKGFIRLETLLAGTGVAAGGLTGAAINGESLEDIVAGTVSGMLMGGLVGYGAGKGIANRKLFKKGQSMIEELDTANLLLGPAMIKASMGSMGGVSAAIWQRMQEGRIVDAKRGIRFMVTEAPGLWLKTATGPIKPRTTSSKLGSLTSNVQQQAGGLSTAILNQVLRPFIAADVTGTAAMQRMGFSPEEALRFMMNGEPTSWQGQALLQINNSGWLIRMLSKFPRVRIGAIERGVEFTPGLSKMFASGPARRSKYEFHTRSAHGAEQLPEKARKARAQFGGGALVAGTLYGYFRDPSLQEGAIASSIMGPAFLPAAAGVAFGKGLKKGGVMRGIQDAALEAADSVPAVSDVNIRSTLSGERFAPLRPLRRGLGIDD